MKSKIQVFMIHGGMTFKTKKDYLRFLKNREVSVTGESHWGREFLDKQLGDDFEIIRPRMPLQDNARYEDWKIHFERYFPQLRDDIILIGNSLGAIFLAKYLSENKFPKKVLSTYLVCPPYDDTLPSEDLVGGFKLDSDLSLIEKTVANLYLMFSEDDEVVPVSQSKKYAKKLRNARIMIFKNKNGHFKVSEFPEIIKMIKKDITSIKN